MVPECTRCTTVARSRRTLVWETTSPSTSERQILRDDDRDEHREPPQSDLFISAFRGTQSRLVQRPTWNRRTSVAVGLCLIRCGLVLPSKCSLRSTSRYGTSSLTDLATMIRDLAEGISDGLNGTRCILEGNGQPICRTGARLRQILWPQLRSFAPGSIPSRCSRLVLRLHHSVADVLYGAEVGCVAGLELVAEAADMHVHRAGAADVFHAPHVGEQLVASEHLSHVFHKE